MATIDESLLRCNKCGFCLAHCPVYKVTGQESSTARGRITLIRAALLDGQLDIDDIKSPVFDCLTCNACADDCPAGVQTADIILSIREELLNNQGSSWTQRLIFRKLLADPSQLRNAGNLLRLIDAVGLRTAASKTGLTRLMRDAGKASAILPKVHTGAMMNNIIRTISNIDRPKYKVAYFPGCHAATIGPTEITAAARILHKHRVEVIVPEFACCGLPASGYGDAESARNLARQNIAVARPLNVDAIVTSCASCSSFLKGYGKLLPDDPEATSAAPDFSRKVKDFSEFLTDIGLLTEMGRVPAKVTYHDPCHLLRYQKIRQQPRNILKQIPGVEFVELPEADMCCGGAGTYAFKNYDLSMKVLDRKIDNVAKTSAAMLVSTCPACLMQLSFGVRQRHLSVRTLSVAALLDEAYRKT